MVGRLLVIVWHGSIDVERILIDLGHGLIDVEHGLFGVKF